MVFTIVNIHELGLQVLQYDSVLLLGEFVVGKQCEIEVSSNVRCGALERADTVAIDGDAVEAMILPLCAYKRDPGPIEGNDRLSRRILCKMEGASSVCFRSSTHSCKVVFYESENDK